MSRPAKAPPAGLAHTYAIIERYLPAQMKPMRAARQQQWDIDFTAINRVHVPVALGSMLALLAIVGHALWRRRLDDVTLLAATVSLALLGNAFICGVISGPHDRYGARMVWIATFVVLIAAVRHFCDDDEPATRSLSGVTEIPARHPCRPCRRPRACDRGSECRAPAIRNDLPEPIRRAGDLVRGADRDQHRHRDAGGLLAGHQPPRAAQAGRERTAIGAGLVGEGAKGAPDRIGHVIQRRRLQRFRDVFAGTAALDQADAEAAEDRRAQTFRLVRATEP